jgi:hypothetical protein
LQSRQFGHVAVSDDPPDRQGVEQEAATGKMPRPLHLLALTSDGIGEFLGKY